MLLGNSSPKSPPVLNDPTTLDPVTVTAQTIPPAPENIPEIVVSARRIPWYIWLGVGVIGFAAVSSLARRR